MKIYERSDIIKTNRICGKQRYFWKFTKYFRLKINKICTNTCVYAIVNSESNRFLSTNFHSTIIHGGSYPAVLNSTFLATGGVLYVSLSSCHPEDCHSMDFVRQERLFSVYRAWSYVILNKPTMRLYYWKGSTEIQFII